MRRPTRPCRTPPRPPHSAPRRLGGTGTPEAYGATLRDALTTAEQSARSNERGLWSAVDPDGTLTLAAPNVSQKARSILTNLPATAAPMAGEEAGIFNLTAGLPKVLPFEDVTALRSRISQAMRQEMMTAGSSPVLRPPDAA